MRCSFLLTLFFVTELATTGADCLTWTPREMSEPTFGRADSASEVVSNNYAVARARQCVPRATGLLSSYGR
jgi:hypothetical protein